MKTTFSILALAASAIASPLGLFDKRAAPACIDKQMAAKFIARFTKVLNHEASDLGDYVTTAQKILTEDFLEISDSINMLAGKPLGSVTANKAGYIAGAQHAPPTTGITNLGITVHSCTHIIWEWTMSGVGKADYPVKGVGLFNLVRGAKAPLPCQASELKLEFNNIAWGLDTGYGWVKQDGTLLGRAPNPAPTPAPATADPAAATTAEPATDSTDAAKDPVAADAAMPAADTAATPNADTATPPADTSGTNSADQAVEAAT